MTIVKQTLCVSGILTEYDDGSIDMLPYKVDENGDEYADLFPNEPPAAGIMRKGN